MTVNKLTRLCFPLLKLKSVAIRDCFSNFLYQRRSKPEGWRKSFRHRSESSETVKIPKPLHPQPKKHALARNPTLPSKTYKVSPGRTMTREEGDFDTSRIGRSHNLSEGELKLPCIKSSSKTRTLSSTTCLFATFSPFSSRLDLGRRGQHLAAETENSSLKRKKGYEPLCTVSALCRSG